MKRWLSLALVALLLVPVLVIPAAAAEVYEFEFMYMPVALSDQFDFITTDSMFFYEGYIPDGMYIVSLISDTFTQHSADPLPISFFTMEQDGVVGLVFSSEICLTRGESISDPVAFTVCKGDFLGGTGVIIGSSESMYDGFYTLRMERVGDLPSQGGFTSMFEDFSAFADSSIDFVSEVARTITGSPLLLLTVGFLFLGGCIGITGRLLDRR